MAGFLDEETWRRGSPFGGRYAWVSPCPERWQGLRRPDGLRPIGAILLVAYAPEPPMTLREGEFDTIREELEADGRFRGAFRKGFNGWPVLLVYPLR